MSNHSSEPKSLARYQAQIDEIDRALDSYGLVVYEDTDGDGDLTDVSSGGAVKVIKRDLDVLVLDLPGLYSGVGSVVIRAEGDTTDYSSQWAGPLSANAAAELVVEAYVPLTVEVTDAVILSAQRSMTIGDSFYTLDPGGVYFNGVALEAAGSSSSEIDLSLDYDESANWSGYLGVSGTGAVTNLNITGQALNQDGSLTAVNAQGGISVSGNVRAGTVNISSAAGLSINSDDFYHTNRDPRQYTNYASLAGVARFNGNALLSSFYNSTKSIVDGAVTRPIRKCLKIKALGDININARVVNVNGLIESGITDYVLNISSSFGSLATQARNVQTDLTLTESMSGVDFFTGSGANYKGGQKFGVIYDHARNAIVVRDLVPQAGKVFITGTVISTGNGTIKAASGYASLDVDVDLDMDVIFEGVELGASREGQIQSPILIV